MNNYPLVEMLAYFVRFSEPENPCWRKKYTHHLKRVRSCHVKHEGGVNKLYYTIETKAGKLLNLTFDEEQLIWELEPRPPYTHHVIDNMLAWVKRHKHLPSRAHRIIPFRFEIIPIEDLNKELSPTDMALTDRMQPFRFQSGKIRSTQVLRIVTRHLENVMITKHLHYVVEADTHRFFHLVYVQDESDWRYMQEVDEELFFAG